MHKTEDLLTEAFALIRRPIDEHFRADDVAKRQEHLHQLSVAEFLRQMVNEEVTPLRARNRAAWEHEEIFKEH